jgi:inhibitor of cysteine peptidase
MVHKIKFYFIFPIIFIFTLLPAFAKDSIVNVFAGKSFQVEIKSNPTTGYQWQLAKPVDKNFVEFESSVFIPPKNNNIMGASGKEIWTFKAVKSGETKLYFQYVRPWEKIKFPDCKNTYLINIK